MWTLLVKFPSTRHLIENEDNIRIPNFVRVFRNPRFRICVVYILNSSFWNECNIKNVDNCSGMHPTFYCLPMCFNKTQTTEQLLEIYICLQNQLLKNRDMHVDTILTTHQSCITPTSNLPIDVVLHIELPVYLQNEF